MAANSGHFPELTPIFSVFVPICLPENIEYFSNKSYTWIWRIVKSWNFFTCSTVIMQVTYKEEP
jgi:hypothetical protein